MIEDIDMTFPDYIPAIILKQCDSITIHFVLDPDYLNALQIQMEWRGNKV